MISPIETLLPGSFTQPLLLGITKDMQGECKLCHKAYISTLQSYLNNQKTLEKKTQHTYICGSDNRLHIKSNFNIGNVR